MASFLNLCRTSNSDLDFNEFWSNDERTELYHFIGKDIMYFHTLFFPAMLLKSNFRQPSGVFIHGFLTVDGEKMSKSLGNILYIRDLLKEYNGEVLRLALLSSHYRQPLNLTSNVLKQAQSNLDRFYRNLKAN